MGTYDPTLTENAPPKAMAAMMLTVGVDIERLTTPWGNVLLGQAIRRCNACPTAAACQAWLNDPHRAKDGFRDFCPNAGMLERFS